MGQVIEMNTGEIMVKFDAPTKGKKSFKELGIEEDAVQLEGGFFRMVFDLEGIGEHHYFQVPTIEVSYFEKAKEIHWQCEFNGETILDKIDHHGKSTVILLDRKTLSDLEHHHENKLILHAEFPKEVSIDTQSSYINFFK